MVDSRPPAKEASEKFLRENVAAVQYSLAASDIAYDSSPNQNDSSFIYRLETIKVGAMQAKVFIPNTSVAGSDDLPLIVSYRGSYNVQNWVDDFSIIPVNDEKLGSKIPLGQSRILDKEQKDRKALHDQVMAIVEANRYKSDGTLREIIPTGHSLGGAIAAIEAGRIKNTFPEQPVKLISYSPASTGSEASACIQELLGENKMLHIWRKGDIVPDVNSGQHPGPCLIEQKPGEYLATYCDGKNLNQEIKRVVSLPFKLFTTANSHRLPGTQKMIENNLLPQYFEANHNDILPPQTPPKTATKPSPTPSSTR